MEDPYPDLFVYNPLFFFLYPLVAFLLFFRYVSDKPGRCIQLRIWLTPRRQYMFYTAAAVLLFFGLLFEYYFRWGQCALSQRYQDDNLRVNLAVVASFKAVAMPFWPDYLTLLNVLRHEPILQWDQDCDWSVEVQDMDNDKVLNQFRKHITTSGEFELLEYPERQLVQVFPAGELGNGKPHADIWLWHRSTRKSTPVVVVIVVVAAVAAVATI